ncbi:MAG: hypothetical protein KGS60_14560, partial [Verrucomicrobia bacterium]|nr:hypothetical protein [Verrucomicrobiota bacterium]
MSISRLLVSILLVPTTGLFAQGAGYFETKRVEDAALAHARRMKAAKEAALEEPAPRDLNPPKPMPASALQARALGPSAEPLYFQVVTPQGLVPLDQWQAAQQPRKPSGAPSASGSTAPPAKGQPAPESSEVARGRTIRLAFLGVGNGRENAVEKGAAEGRAVSLEAAEPVKPQVGETAKPGRVAAGVKAPARAEVSPVPARAAAPVPVVSPEPVPAPDDEVVAVMEEIPSLKTGGEPKRRLLGFMSGKGVEAALMTAEAPSVAGSEKPAATVEDRPPEARRVPAVERVVKESQPAPVPPQHEEKLAAAPPGAPRETFL